MSEDQQPPLNEEPAKGTSSLKERVLASLRQARDRSQAAWRESKIGERMRAKAEQWHLREKVQKVLPADLAKSLPTSFEPLAMWEFTQKAFAKQGSEFWGLGLTLLLCAWFLADILALQVERFIPEPPVAHAVRSTGNGKRSKTLEDYNIIFARNLFNSEGRIPGEESNTPSDMGGAPVKTTLPFNLVGTLIMRDELRSIATIEDKSATSVYPVRVNDEIPSKAKILSIEPRRVIFVNTSSGRREFLELPEDPVSSNPRVALGTPKKSAGGPGIERVSPNQFNVARTEVDAALKDLNQVLTQARAVPNFENGLPAGYKLFQIVPGSIYDKLGLQNGDTICGLNGSSINDPGKAFEMLGELKTSSHMELCVKRDGKTNNNSYDIR